MGVDDEKINLPRDFELMFAMRMPKPKPIGKSGGRNAAKSVFDKKQVIFVLFIVYNI